MTVLTTTVTSRRPCGKIWFLTIVHRLSWNRLCTDRGEIIIEPTNVFCAATDPAEFHPDQLTWRTAAENLFLTCNGR